MLSKRMMKLALVSLKQNHIILASSDLLLYVVIFFSIMFFLNILYSFYLFFGPFGLLYSVINYLQTTVLVLLLTLLLPFPALIFLRLELHCTCTLYLCFVCLVVLSSSSKLIKHQTVTVYGNRIVHYKPSLTPTATFFFTYLMQFPWVV